MKAVIGFVLAVASACGTAVAAEAQSVTADIAGVVAAGTPIRLVKDGFNGSEGPLPQSDGSLLFTENTAGRIIHLAADGSTSVWIENSGSANALAVTPKGEIVATITAASKPGISVVKPGAENRMLVSEYQGVGFNRPNDLVTGKRGQIYFSDPLTPGAADAARKKSAVYLLGADGRLEQIANDIERPNGVALSPDERTLYVANTAGEWITAFKLDKAGKVIGRSQFAKLAMPPPAPPAASTTGGAAAPAALSSGADGVAVDRAGRLYVATAVGVQVFSDRGAALGIIVLPRQPQNLAFAGKGRATLYVVGRGAVYRIDTKTRGPKRAGK
jgi:gluconolactonase